MAAGKESNVTMSNTSYAQQETEPGAFSDITIYNRCQTGIVEMFHERRITFLVASRR